jgi:hypothetical protein
MKLEFDLLEDFIAEVENSNQQTKNNDERIGRLFLKMYERPIGGEKPVVGISFVITGLNHKRDKFITFSENLLGSVETEEEKQAFTAKIQAKQNDIFRLLQKDLRDVIIVRGRVEQ